MNLTIEQKEELRHEVLAALAVRAPAALSPRQIGKAVKRELDFLFEDADTEAALEYLRGLDLVQFRHDELGASKYWNVTTAGIQKYERL